MIIMTPHSLLLILLLYDIFERVKNKYINNK